MMRYQCNTCGKVAEGAVEELHAQGWRCRSLTKNNRVKRICACPEHTEMMKAELGGSA